MSYWNKFKNVFVDVQKNKTNDGYVLYVISEGESDRTYRAKNKEDIKRILNTKIKKSYAWRYGSSK